MTTLPNINWQDPAAIRQFLTTTWANYTPEAQEWKDITPTQYSWLSDATANTLGKLAAPQTQTYTSAQVGNFNPYQTVGYDAYTGQQANLDPSLTNQDRTAQQESLQNWKNLAANGLTADERAAVQQVQDSTLRAAQTANAGVLQDMAMRGTLGSGAELAGRLGANAAAANLANQHGNQLNQLMLGRQMSAQGAADSMANNMRAGDASQAATQAQLFQNYQNQVMAAQNAARMFGAQSSNQANQWAAAANLQGSLANQQATNAANQWNTGQKNQMNYMWQSLNNQRDMSNQNAQNQFAIYNNQGRQNTSNSNAALNAQWALQNQQGRNGVVGQNNQTAYNALSGLSNALNGQATGVQQQQSADANRNAANTALWTGVGTSLLGTALDNWDTIKGWFS